MNIFMTYFTRPSHSRHVLAKSIGRIRGIQRILTINHDRNDNHAKLIQIPKMYGSMAIVTEFKIFSRSKCFVFSLVYGILHCVIHVYEMSAYYLSWNTRL